MIRKPLMVLVCLHILVLVAVTGPAMGYTGSGVPGTGIQGDALSADPTIQTVPTVRTYDGSAASGRSKSSTVSAPSTQFPRSRSTGSYHNPHTYGLPTGQNPSTAYQVPGSIGNPGPVGGMWGPFSPSGCGFGWSPCIPTLPRPGCKQFQINGKLWYAKLNGSTIAWGTSAGGGRPTELDLHDDLGLSRHEFIPEYEGRFQVRPNWGIRASFMPLRYRDDFLPTRPFWFGNLLFPAFVPSLTNWERNIYRFDLVYDWFQAQHAVSSIFAGYSLYDDKITVSNNIAFQSRTRSQGFGLAFGGMSIERAITNLGCTGATASIHCKGSVQFLEGYVGYDLYGVGRVSVPMGFGRFGYLEAGWRWMVLERSYPTNVDRTSFDGLIGAAGVVF